MGQTPEGAEKAQNTIRQRYGADYFRKRARNAGKASKGGGFNDPEVVEKAVRIRRENALRKQQNQA